MWFAESQPVVVFRASPLGTIPFSLTTTTLSIGTAIRLGTEIAVVLIKQVAITAQLT